MKGGLPCVILCCKRMKAEPGSDRDKHRCRATPRQATPGECPFSNSHSWHRGGDRQGGKSYTLITRIQSIDIEFTTGTLQNKDWLWTHGKVCDAHGRAYSKA